jgi:glycosyltransferase involved in cell wall biosynthesis
MDVVLLTSRHEGLPNVLLEAQSLGVPVVAPDVGGVGETILSGRTGWAVREADAASLAERLLFCLRERAWAEKARAAGPAFVRERFGIQPMLRRMLEIYGL